MGNRQGDGCGVCMYGICTVVRCSPSLGRIKYPLMYEHMVQVCGRQKSQLGKVTGDDGVPADAKVQDRYST